MALGDWHKRVVGGAKGLMTQLPIGIDFGVGSLKILQIVGGEPPTLVAAGFLATPDELIHDSAKRLTFQLEALPKLVKSLEFRGKRAVCTIPASCAAVKHMQLQVEAGVSVSALVNSAVSAQFGCDPSALVYRHSEVAQIARKSEVICMAASRETVQRLMAAIKAAKLEPVGMHSEFHSTIHAFNSVARKAENDGTASLYLDLGAGATKVSIAHGQSLVFARTIDLGGRHLDSAVAKQLKLSLGEARERRLQMTDLVPKAARRSEGAPGAYSGGLAMLAAGMRMAGADSPAGAATAVMEVSSSAAPGDVGTHADLSEPLEILCDEITMCLRYHETLFPERKVTRTVFVGGEARHLALCQHIAKILKLPAQLGDPVAGVARTGEEPVIGVDFSQSQPGWAVALGLCQSPTDL